MAGRSGVVLAFAAIAAGGCLGVPSQGADAAADDADGGGTGDGPGSPDGAPLPTAGLLAHYPLDDILGTGSDDVVGGFDATCADACPTATEGRIGGAASFGQAADQALLVADTAQLRLSQGTVTVWARLEFGGSLSGVIAKPLAGSASAKSWEIYLDAENRPHLKTAPGDDLAAAAPIATDAWVHLALSWDTAGRSLRLDGVPIAVDDTPGELTYDATPFVFGTGYVADVFAVQFRGALDDLRIYDRVLDDDEVAALVAQ